MCSRTASVPLPRRGFDDRAAADDTEPMAGDVFTAVSPLVAFEDEHDLPSTVPATDHDQPGVPLTVTGTGRIDHAHLPRGTQRQLGELAAAVPRQWGLLFVADSQGRRWTLYSPDLDHTAMFAPAAHTLELEYTVLVSKFPAWSRGWQIA
jgi:hypothetical protein